jgi:hypothetical protein
MMYQILISHLNLKDNQIKLIREKSQAIVSKILTFTLEILVMSLDFWLVVLKDYSLRG